jgi:hypothetical protein
MMTPLQVALYHPGWFFLKKVLAVKAPKNEQKLPWLPKTGLLKLDSQDFPTMHTLLFNSQTEIFP